MRAGDFIAPGFGKISGRRVVAIGGILQRGTPRWRFFTAVPHVCRIEYSLCIIIESIVTGHVNKPNVGKKNRIKNVFDRSTPAAVDIEHVTAVRI